MNVLGFGLQTDLRTVVFVMVPVAFTALLYETRWLRRRGLESRAPEWPAVDAIVNNSYEIDESSASAELRRLFEGPPAPQYIPRWATAIEYTYRVRGEIYPGTFFLPGTSSDGSVASEAGRAWIGKKSAVRANPRRPQQSFFLVEDGAPGRPHIPLLAETRPYLTTLSLK